MSVAYPFCGLWTCSLSARFSPSFAVAYRIAVSSPGVGASERVRHEPTPQDPFISLLVAFSGKTDGMRSQFLPCARLRPGSPITFRFSLRAILSSARLPCSHSATRSVLFPAPCGNFAALLFRFLPEEISRANTTRRGFGPLRARFLPAPSQKAPLALGSRAPRDAGRRGVPSEIRAI